MKNLPIRIRNISAEDLNFVFNSWLKSYRASAFSRSVTNTIYFDNHHKLIEKYVLAGNHYIACDQNDPSQIFGYVVAERVDGILVIHYLYVKQSFRNMGIGKLLLEQVGFDVKTASIFTHMSEQANRLAAKYNFIYHPYLAFNVSERLEEQPKDPKKD